ncbi:copper chaperone PCu(A)C [Candidatus Magnetaquicoccus inordinatus]|uniref:copper chaperone PCu(A)C n=1 Tax=Candidatus Magnetaquicoccus inordinatus TaxID=2496818 RepID=UPI00102B67B6|nr:copper chaperone PCu(A)C [Candidatus Magnetaquicoccus inordinatus]
MNSKVWGVALLFSGFPMFSWAGDLSIQDAWVRATPPNMQTTAAYMVIRNTGKAGKTVVGAASPMFARVEFHETVQQGGVAGMVARDSLVIDAGGQVALKPGGYHMMLIGLRGKALQAGDKVPLMLQLSDGSQETVSADVRAAPSAAAQEHQHHKH